MVILVHRVYTVCAYSSVWTAPLILIVIVIVTVIVIVIVIVIVRDCEL